MTERRARGTSPAGRGNRRTSRAVRPRPADTAARPAAARTTRKRSDPADKKKAGTRKTEARSGEPERTILGLSTGKAVVLAMVVCALALTLAVPLRTYFTQQGEAAQLAQQRTELESDLARLRDRRAQQQDPAYVRSEARDRLRLVMPGETPYIVQVPGIEAPASPTAAPKSKAPDPWYTELWRSVSEPQTPPPAPVQPAVPGPSPTVPPEPDQDGPR
ncbi:FtsB family cell division protein [Nocardia australiensis]|uniref:FtsB family cell division protein n=1 Tax=Nocardia australiensis TaxID=2887191 RepID=UPI001D15CEDD|nr:septum formation initiator family protein [Nocardia australiensis]